MVPRVRRRLHQRADDPARGLPRHRGPRRRCSPASTPTPAATTRRPGSTRARTSAGGGRSARPVESVRQPTRGAQRAVTASGGGTAPRQAATATTRCSTRAACSRCSSGTSPATPRRWSTQICGITEQEFLRGGRRAHAQLRPGAHQRLRLRGRLDPAHRRGAVHPHRRDPAAAAGQHRPARRRHPGAARPRLASRAPPTSRRCSTSCPATCRCPTPHQHLDLDVVHRRGRGHHRASGATWTPTWSACSRRGGATRRPPRTTSASTTCRGSPAATPTTTPCSSRSTARRGLLRGRREPGRRHRPTPRCNGWGWPTWTGWWSATSS